MALGGAVAGLVGIAARQSLHLIRFFSTNLNL